MKLGKFLETKEKESDAPKSIPTIAPKSALNSAAAVQESDDSSAADSNHLPLEFLTFTSPQELPFGEEKGLYTVRSCYKGLMDSDTNVAAVEWAQMWKLSLSPKIKVFVWQACSNLLPTAEFLRNRRVNCSEICYLCGVGGESVSHLFTECAVALSCWSMINVNIPVICTGFIDWLSFIMNHLDQTSLSLVLVICWKLWTARNHKLWNNQTSNAKQIVEESTAFLDAWKKVHASVPVIPTDKNTAHWEKPPLGVLKLNVDAAFNKDSNCMGMGFILRNHEGAFVAAKNIKWYGIYHSKEAEAIGVREALKWLKIMELDTVIIESDALLVTQGINGVCGVSSFDLILEDIRKLAKGFSCISFVFVKRSANSAAHLLARKAVLNADCMEWVSSPPSFISHVLASEVV
nr:uncharacterized protein LOC109155154 [Ipomoea batatas]